MSLRLLLLGIAALICLAVVIGIFAAMTYSAPDTNPSMRRITMDHIFNGTFSPERMSLNWVPEGMSPHPFFRNDSERVRSWRRSLLDICGGIHQACRPQDK